MPALIEFDRADIRFIVRSYNNGISMANIAEDYEVTQPTIRRVLVAAGVTIRPRGRYAA